MKYNSKVKKERHATHQALQRLVVNRGILRNSSKSSRTEYPGYSRLSLVKRKKRSISGLILHSGYACIARLVGKPNLSTTPWAINLEKGRG